MSYNSKYNGEKVESLLDKIDTIVIPDTSNCATKEELAEKQDEIEDLASIREGAAKGATALQSVPDDYAKKSDLNNKVDKVTGKQLSEEDFTSALKTKLEGLSNYDDTELSEALSTLRGDFDKLVSGDTTTAIETFNEVTAFLDGIQDSQDLSNIIVSIEQQIAAKQDKLTSGTNIKTINNTSILGSGNISIPSYDDTELRELIKAQDDGIKELQEFKTNADDSIKELYGDVSSLYTNKADNEQVENKVEKIHGSYAKADGLSSIAGGYIYALPDATNGEEDAVLATRADITKSEESAEGKFVQFDTDTDLAICNGFQDVEDNKFYLPEDNLTERNVIALVSDVEKVSEKTEKRNVSAVAVGEGVDDLAVDYATKGYVDNAITTSIINALNGNF